MDALYVVRGDGSLGVPDRLRDTLMGRVAYANVVHRSGEITDPETFSNAHLYVNDGDRPSDLESPIERFIKDTVTGGLGYHDDLHRPEVGRKYGAETTYDLQRHLKYLDWRIGRGDYVADMIEMLNKFDRLRAGGITSVDMIETMIAPEIRQLRVDLLRRREEKLLN